MLEGFPRGHYGVCAEIENGSPWTSWSGGETRGSWKEGNKEKDGGGSFFA